MKYFIVLIMLSIISLKDYAQDSSKLSPANNFISTYSRSDNWKLQKMNWCRAYSVQYPSIFAPRYIQSGWVTNPEYVSAPFRSSMPFCYQPGQMMLSVSNIQTLGKLKISNAYYFNEQTMQLQQAKTTFHFGR